MMKHLATVGILLFTVVAGQPRATTTSSPVPQPDADLQEVWDWLASLNPSDTEDGGAAINVNMYMAYNHMSMTGTKFSMNVGNDQAADEEGANRMADGGDDEKTKTWSWSWTPSPIGGTVNMYMYENAMSMEDTVFTMDVAEDGSVSGFASANFASTMPSFERMRSGKGGWSSDKGLSVNMFMYNNSMAMKETIFTMDVDN